MVYKDGEQFTIYCDKPYDQNYYELVHHDGKSMLFFEYESIKLYWYHNKEFVSHVKVIPKQKKSSKAKGF